MAKRLFTYPYDAEEEASSLKALLNRCDIDFYETPGSQWTFSRAAIWISHDEDFTKAQALLHEHTKDFAEVARAQYQAQTGYDPLAPLPQRANFLIRHLLRRKASLALLALAGILLYLYLRVFLNLFF